MELVMNTEKGLVTSSRVVAEYFGMEHRTVLRAIDTKKGSAQNCATLDLMYFETTYTHEQNKQEYREVLMNRDGFSLLAMGFTGAKALEFQLKFISEFNRMEQELKNHVLPTTYKDALIALVAEVEAKERAEALLIEQEPKVKFADALVVSDKNCLIGELAKILNQNGIDIGQNRLFVWLRDNSYLIKRKDHEDYNMPTQKSVDMKLFVIKKGTVENRDGSIRTTRTAMVTPKGQQYFINKFL